MTNAFLESIALICWTGMFLQLAGNFTLNLVDALPNDQADVIQLTYDNYDELTASKTVFIKFFAPWCAHCKRLQPIWSRLAKLWENDEVGLIAESDCTDNEEGGGRILCDYFGIRSFPTLKFGYPEDLKEYNGDKSLEALSYFAKKHLVPICSVTNLSVCDYDSKANIQRYIDLPVMDLQTLIEGEENKLEEAEKQYDDEIERLTKAFQSAEKTKQKAIEKVANGDLNLMKQVMWVRQNPNGGKDATRNLAEADDDNEADEDDNEDDTNDYDEVHNEL